MQSNKLLIFLIALLSIVTITLSYSLYRAQDKLRLEKKSCAREMFDLAVEKPDVALKLYQLMKDVDLTLQKHKIEYWLSDGTLIGAVRNQGIIPYDDDLDIQIDTKELGKLELALLDLEKLGYKISENRRDWVQILSYDKCSKAENHIDIFAMNFDGDRSFYANSGALELWGKKRSLKKSEIFPLKQYKFGELYISGPQNPLPYLKELYSEDVMTKGCIWPKHSNPAIKKGRCVELEGEMLEPLKPTGPLIDNSDIINKL